MPALPPAGAARARSLVEDLAERRRAEQRWLAELAPDVNLDVEAERRLRDPFGFRQPSSGSYLADLGRIAGAALGGKGIVLARGPGGRQTVREAIAALGPYMQRLVKSPHTYVFERMTPQELDEISQGRVQIGATGVFPVAQERPAFKAWLGTQMPPGEPMPNYTTRVMVTPEGGAATTGHEVGHALGLQRLMQRLFGEQLPTRWSDMSNLQKVGGLHADLLADPRTHRMLTESLKRWPALGDYYATYRHAAGPRTGYGELFNEAWQQRQATRMGVPRRTPAEQPWYQEFYKGKLPAYRERYATELESLRQSGRLPPTLTEGSAMELPLMQRYEGLRRALPPPGANLPNETLGRILTNFLQGLP